MLKQLAVPTLFVCATSYGAVTFHKDVEPILQRSCQECHRAGEIAPMSLLTYEQVRPYAKAIKSDILLHKMPPWPADPHFSKFENDRSLTPEEVLTISAWVDSGAREGDKSAAPAPRKWVEGWNITKPDLIIQMPQAYEVAAKGEIEYTYFVIPSGFTEDRWVQQVEVRPSDRTVVHHAQVFLREPGSKWMADAKPGVPYVPPNLTPGSRFANIVGASNDMLTVYTPGMVPDIYKPGQAKQIKAGTDFVLVMHYTASGKDTKDRTSVGIVFAKGEPTERIITTAAINNNFVIPAGDGNFKAVATAAVINPMTMVSLFPHMHLRGKSFQYDLIYPTGETKTILRVDHWSLNWQPSYKLAEPIQLTPGMKVRATAWWDNSANNPSNPDPSKEVKWGDQSWEEMLVGFYDVAVNPKITNKNIYKKME
ncbi:MAG TPA: thiol-disulfide isomerase [Bryobacteraceae bacterium]|nr:thiol-disulfide isomerase [Bryobacteraceae bacterium]